MATRNLEKDKARFAAWRLQKHGRETIPDELWQTASAHIPTLGLNRASREFRLNFTKLREKAGQFGVVLAKRKARRVAGAMEVAFQELPLSTPFVTPATGRCLVLERPDGIRVRIEGQLPDADYVGKLAACLWR